jgi:hypothetical protein
MQAIYQPIDASRQEIRRLILSPASFDDPICGTLDIVSLGDRPNYDALSYAWGGGFAPIPMKIGEEEVKITPNLDIALRHLRHRLLIRIVWVDAVCINQKNLPEKTDQVAIMKRIYQCAVRTLVWLGTSGNESDIAMRSIQNLDEEYWNTYKFHIQFTEIISRSWFTRIWVVQEFVLGKNPRIGCGTFWVYWDSFIKAWAVYSKQSGPLEAESTRRLQEVFLETFKPSWLEDIVLNASEHEIVPEHDIIRGLQHVLEHSSLVKIGFTGIVELLQDIKKNPVHWSVRYTLMKNHQSESPISKALARKWRLMQTVPLIYHQFLYQSRETFLNSGSLSIVQILKGTMNLRSSDARDKIYGILGLVSEQARKEIPINYQMKPEWTFVPTTEYIIKHESGGLALLGLLWDMRPFKIPYPSWGVDFTISADWKYLHSPVFLRGSCINASWKWPQVAKISIDHTTLSASGFSFGEVKELIEFDNSGDFQTCINQLQKVECLVARECPLNEPLWRTLIGIHNTGPEAMDSDSPFGLRFDIIMGRSASQDKPTNSVMLAHRFFQDAILPTVRGRKFFVTDLAYAGIATPQIEMGDTIAVIPNMERAAVLRSAEPSDLDIKPDLASRDIRFHRITGFAYVGCHDREQYRRQEKDGFQDWKEHSCFRDKQLVDFHII